MGSSGRGGGGASFPPGLTPKVGQWFGPARMIGGAAGTSAFAAGTVTPFVEIPVNETIGIDQLGFRVSTLEAGMTGKVLLFGPDADGYPVTLVKDSGPITCAATGDQLSGAFPIVTLSPATYWATIITNAGNLVRFLCCTQAPRTVQASTVTNIWQAVNYLQANAGPFAAPTSPLTSWGDNNTTGSNGAMPVVYLHRAA